jgi:hypothetical protein
VGVGVLVLSVEIAGDMSRVSNGRAKVRIRDHAKHDSYAKIALGRALKVQEVILRAMAKKISWWQAAEIIGISNRQMRWWRRDFHSC